ncbi:hypothetical protein HK096_006871, partial [Nowakowskiella sp. JEL0078]
HGLGGILRWSENNWAAEGLIHVKVSSVVDSAKKKKGEKLLELEGNPNSPRF